MATINGIVTEKQFEDLANAGYSVVKTRSSGEGMCHVEVFVDCDVNDLLSPPLCPECGEYMGDGEVFTATELGKTLRWTCVCGSTVWHTELYDNKGEKCTS